MFVLDTNILSAQIAITPPAEVAAWVRRQPRELLFTTAICRAEVLAGLASMAHGRRRAQLTALNSELFRYEFAGRILPFDSAAAEAYGEVFALRRRAGRPTAAVADLMIAAIARAHGATVVTRNTADFEDCGVALVNPWTA
jgi:predicted nucleic acid-binding protein